MRKILLIVAALLLVFTLSACAEEGFTDISNEELVEILASDTEYLFIDVRTSGEFYNERIPGFNLNYDFYIFEDDYSLLDGIDTTMPIVIMCNSGNRSVDASNIFLEIGFTEVYNLEYGIEGWDGETIN